MTDSPSPEILASNHDILVQSLPTVSRLALVYAPHNAREQTLALLALDARLAHLLRRSREPMMAQLRLAWWRESLGQPAEQWPQGEPLLALLKSWNGHHGGLSALVDGWENMTGPAPLPRTALEAMAQGRGEAFAALAVALGRSSERDAALVLGRAWALNDLAMRLGHGAERETVLELVRAYPASGVRVSRALRPLMVLQGLAARRLAKGDETGATSPAALLKAMRLGLLGF